ncbi:divergent polysaccharide deacetylase family protein [Corallincola platygyrae]
MPLKAEEKPKIVIVIDDVGNSADDQVAVELPGDVTLAFLPFTPHSRRLAELAHQQGKEVMLHMPMAARAGNKLGEGALTNEMGVAALQQTLVKALASIPHVAGVNNHMGSELTESLPHMAWTMRVLRYYPLYFIDSRTTVYTCAQTVAEATGVPSLRRHVFLDNEEDEVAIERQFDKLLALAKRRGEAIGIAHPYPETIAVLQRRLADLDAQGVELVPASALVSEEAWAKRAASPLAPVAVELPQHLLALLRQPERAAVLSL